MPAVVRVKRLLDEEPSDTLILNCKRRKIDSENIEDQAQLSPAILKFAGTIQKEEDILPHLKTKYLDGINELKAEFKKHTLNLSEKLRHEHQESSKNNRLKIVNKFRSCIGPSNTSEAAESDFAITVLDVETDINKNKATEIDQYVQEKKYVYDLYYTCSDDSPEFEDYHSVQHLTDCLPAGSLVENSFDCDSDSEDSNAESNWRNDYPDESDLESVGEEDMIEAMENMKMGDDLLSSDESDDFIYGHSHDDIDNNSSDSDSKVGLQSEISLYGEKYGKFKAKFLKTFKKPIEENDLDYGDIEDDDLSD